MSNTALCDLNRKSHTLKLSDECPNPKCNCQKVITLTPHQYMLEVGSIKSKLQNIFRERQTAWKKILKPAVNVAAPFIGMAVCARTENPKL